MAKSKDPEKEKLIFQTALDIIMREGFTGLRMSRLAKEAQIATGTLYIYFKNKNELINRLFLYLKQKHMGLTLAGYSPDAPFKSCFKTVWYNFMEYAINYPEESAFIDQYNRSIFLDTTTRSKATDLLKPIDELLERGKKEQLIKPLETSLLRNQLNGAIRFLAYAHHNQELNLTAKQIDQAFILAWDSIKV